MSWNVNSLGKDNFQRVRLIEAHNSIFNYDLISICETSLNDSVELPDTLLNDYTFVPANNPANIRNGGVGLFFKNSLPVIVRTDFSIDESIVVEPKFGRTKICFTVFTVELLLLTITLLNFKISYQTLKIYIQKSELKILFQYFLQVTLIMWRKNLQNFSQDCSQKRPTSKKHSCKDVLRMFTRFTTGTQSAADVLNK